MENKGFFINITMTGPGQLQLQTNAPPGHFMSMLRAAEQTFIQQAVQREQSASGVELPPPGFKLR